MLGEMSERAPSLRPTRRTEGVRVQGRSARVVEAVLDATAVELGQAGFRGLRIEDVATRSGVNKTTIYRRWPTKIDLVRATMERLADEPTIPHGGSLRGDLSALVREVRDRLEQPVTRGFVRMIQAERAEPEVAALLRDLRARHLAARRVIFERAIQRGELPPDSDATLLVEFTMAPLLARLVHLQIEADDRFLDALVAMIVAGASAGAARS